MALATPVPAPALPAFVAVHRLTVDDVHRMVAAGVLDEHDRLELVEGVLVEMTPIGAEHESTVDWLNQHFAPGGDAAWRVRIQHTLLVAGGYLLPDVAIVEPLPRSQQPDTALLVIEVAQTSQARDREKARDYAQASVPEYWIVDLVARTVTVHHGPKNDGYEHATAYADGATITPLLTGAAPVPVSDLLG